VFEQIVLSPVLGQAQGLSRFIALEVLDEGVFDVCPLLLDISHCAKQSNDIISKKLRRIKQQQDII